MSFTKDTAKLYPETKQKIGSELIKLRWNKDNTSETVSFVQDISQKIGLSPRTIEREIQLSRDIGPETKYNAYFKGNQYCSITESVIEQMK